MTLRERYACRDCGGNGNESFKSGESFQATSSMMQGSDGQWRITNYEFPSCPRCADLPDFGLGFTVDPERVVWWSDEHLVDITNDGWAIRHAGRCRQAMLDCEYHAAATSWKEPPTGPGLYRMANDGWLDGPIEKESEVGGPRLLIEPIEESIR